MATVFKLIEGATETDLNDGINTKLSQYTPAVADMDAEYVDETAVIIIADADADDLDTIRGGIIRRLKNAQLRQANKARDKTYITFKPEGASDTWRSEIRKGRIANEQNAHGEAWGSSPVEFTIIWTRYNHWEGSEDQVPLTNTNGADNTSGLNVYNCNDGSGSPPNDRVNYVEIKAADVLGEMPAATRIEMTNPYATDLGYVWIGQNFTDPTNHVWTYEGESATGASSSAAGDASGGNYGYFTLTSSAAFQDKLTWSLSAAALDASKGGAMKMVISFYNGIYWMNPDDVWWRIKLQIASLPMWISGRVKPDTNYALGIRDMITFNLPPWLRGQANQSALDFVLQAQQESGSSKVLEIDTMYLIPADGWRYIQSNHLIDTGERLVDDGISGDIYVDDAAGDNKHSSCVGFGSPILLQPNKLQRLYFLTHSTTAYTAEIDRYLVVKVYYRPRRYTI